MATPAHCPRCARQTPEGARFCSACGLDLSSSRARIATGLLPSNQMLQRRYLVIRRLAQGGQSAVYLARDTFESNAPRAIKEMSESNLGPAEREKAINDFIREASMLARLSHPALATVYSTFVDGQKHYLVMEFVEGHNLEDELVELNRPLEWERVVVWGIALCGVLDYLHGQTPAIIYRDLKPANVMLTPSGTIKLVDFGIARWLHPNRARDTAQLGTDGYAPLEQYSGRSEPRSDLYALGASLYHLLTGRVPEAAPSRIGGQALIPIRGINPRVPEAVEQLVERALALQPRDRFQDAAAMRDALTLVHQPGAARTSRATMIPAPRSGRIGPATAGPAAGASPQVARARLHVWPLRLDAGYLDANDTALMVLDIANRGAGELLGKVECSTRCLRAEPERLNGSVSVLQVSIDTTGLLPGPYSCHIAVHTNGGSQIIPVRFVVRQ
ncbi:MAG TPA: serine/threonine-protein kinase [Ktedonobacterales bacterium]|nr:serine/threonine-protein kinase [Ktedonobacterales bacterium]